MTTGVLCPTPILQFFDNSGNPAVGGSVLTQIGGSNAATYQDVGLGTPLPNPIPLNSRGEVSTSFGASSQCFLTPNTIYTFTLFDANGNQLWVASYINGFSLTQNSVGGALYPYNAVLDGGMVPTDDNLHYPYQDARRYGVVGDGVIDDTVALNSIGSAAWTQNATITTPSGLTMLTTDTVTFNAPYTALMMDPGSTIEYSGPTDRPCLVLGTAGSATSGRDFNVTVNFHANGNDYASNNCVGVRITGAQFGNRYRLNRAVGFTVNWELYGTDNGIYYNTFDLGISENANKHLQIHATTSDSPINENLFLNGDFQTLSTYVPGVNGNCYGVNFIADPGAYTGQNKNHFVKPCFQLTQGGVVGERIPIVFNNSASYNQFQNCRFEGYNGELVRVASGTAGVINNTVDIGYNFTAAGTLTAYMTETDGGFSVGNQITALGRPLSEGYSSGDLMAKSWSADTNIIGVTGAFFQSSGSGTETATGTAKIGWKYVLMPQSSNAIGWYVDTSYYKNFTFRYDCIATNPGRIAIVAYNSNGNQLSTTRAVYFGGLSENSNFGGHCYTQGSDSSGTLTFRVDSNVDYIKLMVGPGTLQGSIRAFTLKGFASLTETPGQNNSLSVFGGSVSPSQMLAASIPNLKGMSYANQGMVIWNGNAASGQIAGWINTADGYGPVAWTISTGYTLNRLVSNDTNKIYVCVGAGTSAGAGGPTGTGQGITDGSCTWNYVAANTVTAVFKNLSGSNIP